MQPLLWSESPHLFASNFGVAARTHSLCGVSGSPSELKGTCGDWGAQDTPLGGGQRG